MGIFCRVYKRKLRFSITFRTSGPTAREKQYLPRYRDFCDFFELLIKVRVFHVTTWHSEGISPEAREIPNFVRVEKWGFFNKKCRILSWIY